MRFGSQNYESFVEIEGKISRNWIHIELLRINFFWENEGDEFGRSVRGFRTSFGVGRSFTLARFFFYKKFFWTDFFQEQGTEFFFASLGKFFGRISALDFG